MKFEIKNTKTNEVKVLEDWEIRKRFECDSFYNQYALKAEQDAYLELLNDEEKADYTCDATIIESETEFLKEMIEYENWTSPDGIMSVHKVISVS